MNWIVVLQAVYFVVMLLAIVQVIYDSRNTTKALSYILAIVFLPVIGIVFYLSFGINYRKRKFYSHKLLRDEQLRKDVKTQSHEASDAAWKSSHFPVKYRNLARFIVNANISPLTAGNKVTLLRNGEQKFPELLQAISHAQHHIHIEYYIYENDQIGNQLADALIERAKAGVEVRFIYDDFGSYLIGRELIARLQQAGVKTSPFYRIRLHALAHRLNFRNHRKIVVIDANLGFTGGINVGDNYCNDTVEKGPQLYWRDMHLRIEGSAVAFLQYIFISDWNFCTDDSLILSADYFPEKLYGDDRQPQMVQMVSSGPDSDLPNILFSLLKAIHAARQRIYITTPYFIPGDALKDALMMAAKSGVDVRLLVPLDSDSKVVNTAAKSYYSDLLAVGIRIFQYEKGFIHTKSIVIDDDLVIMGTANMDIRSFDINFEVNVLIYGHVLAKELAEVFAEDVADALEIDPKAWLNRSALLNFWERVVRLFSPMM